MKNAISVEVPITKTDSKRMQVFGWANVAVKATGDVVVDLHDDEIAPEELELAAYRYVLRYREGGYDHTQMGVARLIESCFFSAEKLKALGLPDTSLPLGWWIGFKVDDPEVWKRVESGELRSFSIGGNARRVEA